MKKEGKKEIEGRFVEEKRESVKKERFKSEKEQRRKTTGRKNERGV